MRTVRRASVRVGLTWAIFLTIMISWMLSSMMSNYLNFLSMKALHQQMMDDPMTYPRPFPEPKIDFWTLISGRPYMPPRENDKDKQPDMGNQNGKPSDNHPAPSPNGMAPDNGNDGRDNEGPIRKSHRRPIFIEVREFLVRMLFAIVLASLTAAWVAKRFTKPLNALTAGVEEYQEGNFDYRIPTQNYAEFQSVAHAMNTMADEVNRHIQRLEDDAERRKQFLANIAHEFRSPVTTMRTMAGALQDGMASDPDRRTRALDALVGSSERLLRLVQDLMELARLDLDHFTLNKRKVILNDLLHGAVNSLTAAAQQHNITIHPVSATDTIIVNADPDRLLQAVDNVIGNAISHAGDGCEIWVSVNTGDRIAIVIKDSGKGIKAEHLQYVCDPFYRADAARTPGDKHSGLGLSIAKRLIEAHGGELNIESRDNAGTTVSMYLPGFTPEAAPAPAEG